MPIADVGAAKIYYTTRGNGPRCLFVHCSLARSGVWHPLLAHLPEFQVICMDLPGHGKSDPCPKMVEPQRLTADAIKSIAANPTHLVGHSFGATAALLASQEMGERCLSLTLIEPVLFKAAQGTGAYDIHNKTMERFSQALELGRIETAAQIFLGLWGVRNDWATLRSDQRRALCERMQVIPTQADAVSNDINKVLGAGQLEKLKCRVALVEGSESPSVIAEIHNMLETRISRLERIKIEGAGHMIPRTHTERLAQIIRNQLEASPV